MKRILISRIILYIFLFLVLCIFLIYFGIILSYVAPTIFGVNSKTTIRDEYLVSNDWSNIWWYKKRKTIDGIEVRVLPKNHLLAGQKGVFATKDFSQYDIIGEYTGIIRKYNNNVDLNNRYIFELEEENDLIIDSKDYGNELRFVNSNINILNEPNVIPNKNYIDGFPRLSYICTKNIKKGEEILIDYGDEYNNYFLSE